MTLQTHRTFADEITDTLPAMRAFAQSLTRNADNAEDLVHDAVVRLLTVQDSFVPGSNFRAWAFTIIRNRFIDQYRRRRYADEVRSQMAAMSPVEPPRQDWVMQLNETADAFDRLPASFRDVLKLIGLEEMSYEQAAEIVGCPVGTIRSRLSRSRSKLLDILESTTAAERRASAARVADGAPH